MVSIIMKVILHQIINVAYGWGKALSTELSPAEKAWFRELADHELAESKLMQAYP